MICIYCRLTSSTVNFFQVYNLIPFFYYQPPTRLYDKLILKQILPTPIWHIYFFKYPALPLLAFNTVATNDNIENFDFPAMKIHGNVNKGYRNN